MFVRKPQAFATRSPRRTHSFLGTRSERRRGVRRELVWSFACEVSVYRETRRAPYRPRTARGRGETKPVLDQRVRLFVFDLHDKISCAVARPARVGPILHTRRSVLPVLPSTNKTKTCPSACDTRINPRDRLAHPSPSIHRVPRVTVPVPTVMSLQSLRCFAEDRLPETCALHVTLQAIVRGVYCVGAAKVRIGIRDPNTSHTWLWQIANGRPFYENASPQNNRAAVRAILTNIMAVARFCDRSNPLWLPDRVRLL